MDNQNLREGCSGFEVQGLGFWVLGVGFRVFGVGFWVLGFEFREKPTVAFPTTLDECVFGSWGCSVELRDWVTFTLLDFQNPTMYPYIYIYKVTFFWARVFNPYESCVWCKRGGCKIAVHSRWLLHHLYMASKGLRVRAILGSIRGTPPSPYFWAS